MMLGMVQDSEAEEGNRPHCMEDLHRFGICQVSVWDLLIREETKDFDEPRLCA